VRVSPVDEASIIEPRGAETEEDSGDEESDNDYLEAQLIEPRYRENAHGGSEVKGVAKERRSTRQIIGACVKTNTKYEDPDFPIDDMLNANKAKPAYKMEEMVFRRPCWKGQPDVREHLNCGAPPADPPVLLLDSGSIGSLKQGHATNCWLLGAAACVATKPDLLQGLIVDFSLEWGVFTFRIFKDGKWKHVTIDDRRVFKNMQQL